MSLSRAAILCVFVLGGCESGVGTAVMFDLTGATPTEATFFDSPYPSDLRVKPSGAPDLTGWPTSPASGLLGPLVSVAEDRVGFPVVPVAWFRFTRALPPTAEANVIAADKASSVLLLDVDAASPEQGRLFPTVAHTFASDGYLPKNVLAVGAAPGIVLTPGRAYAFVVQRSFDDADGHALAIDPALATLAQGGTPDGALGAKAKTVFAPLWAALDDAAVPATNVAAATVFTTGDVVTANQTLTNAVLAAYDVTISDLTVETDVGDSGDRYCELRGTVVLPQFQDGMPPYDTGGQFHFGTDGLPIEQRAESVPLTITLPNQPMPASGYPLMMYLHGSGGDSLEGVDQGPVTVAGGQPTQGQGPAYVVAPFGIALATSALPFSPERVPGAGEFDYLNFNNLASFRDNFRQGVIEQRLFIAALSKLQIPASSLGACTSLPVPAGGAYFFDPSQLVVEGWSMGAMYTNLMSAIEPRVRAAVALGAGGYWSYFITKTTIMMNLQSAVQGLLLLGEAPSFLHPALHLFETAVEASDPMVAMPRLARDPLPGAPVRPIYEPVGLDDKFFPSELYDAMALAYGHDEVGSIVWPTMQTTLALDGLDGLLPYPTVDNRTSSTSTPYTGVVAQYEGDGLADPHAIGFQLDAVKYQYGCFLSTFLASGAATVPAPMPLGTRCPTL